MAEGPPTSAPMPDLATWLYAYVNGTKYPVNIYGDQAGHEGALYLFLDDNGVQYGQSQKRTTHVPIAASYTVVPEDTGKTIHNAPATTAVNVNVNGNNLKPGHELVVAHTNIPASPNPIGIVFSSTDIIVDGRTGTVKNPTGTVAPSYVAPRLAVGAKIKLHLHDQSNGKSTWHVTHEVRNSNGGFD